MEWKSAILPSHRDGRVTEASSVSHETIASSFTPVSYSFTRFDRRAPSALQDRVRPRLRRHTALGALTGAGRVRLCPRLPLMRSSKATPATSLGEARAALTRGDWEKARTIFDRLLREAPSAEAWEGLAIATSYLDDGDVSIAAREEAFRRYRETGNPLGAARCAGRLANDVMEFRGDPAIANGWIQRAQSLLVEIPGPSGERALLLALRAHMAPGRATHDAERVRTVRDVSGDADRACHAACAERIRAFASAWRERSEGRQDAVMVARRVTKPTAPPVSSR